jgi:hypothetical protein
MHTTTESSQDVANAAAQIRLAVATYEQTLRLVKAAAAARTAERATARAAA